MTTDVHASRRRWTSAAGFTLLLAAVVTVALGVAAGGCSAAGGDDAKTKTAAAAKPMYHCPMHPEYVSDKQGDCPICGMRLVPIPGRRDSGSAPAASRGVPASVAETSSTPGQARPAGDSVPPVMDLGADRARLAGVRSVDATLGRISRTIRAVGTVAVDETRVRQVTTKVAGFVEKLFVNATGQMVHAGEPLFELYSPELLASQEEYVRARQSAAEFSKSGLPEVRRGGADLALAARRRLELFDVPPGFLQRLDESGTVQRTVTFDAPFTGFVTGKNVVAGQRIEPGMDLMTVTDMSQVWVIAQLFEAEAKVAQPGRAVRVTLPYDSNVTLSGRIMFVYPTLDTDTRAVKVRLEFPNPRGVLKPGMFVTVELGVDSAAGIVVPDSAVIDSGTRQLVFIEVSPGRFTAREVSVALRADGQAVIRTGVAAGERVAVSANFLLDSETRLRNAARASVRRPQES